MAWAGQIYWRTPVSTHVIPAIYALRSRMLAGCLQPRKACKQCIALRQRDIVSGRARHGIEEKWDPGL